MAHQAYPSSGNREGENGVSEEKKKGRT